MKITCQVPSTFWSSTSTSIFPYTKYSSTSSTDKYVLKYKYQLQVLYLTPTMTPMNTHQHPSTLMNTHQHPSTPINTHQHPSTPINTHQHPSTPINTHRHPLTPINTYQHPSTPINTHQHPSTSINTHVFYGTLQSLLTLPTICYVVSIM